MSMDRSLKVGSSLARHRNVLTRAERIGKLTESERWKSDQGVFGLPKVANRSVKVAKKEKKKEEAAAGAAAAPAAAAAAPAKKASAAKK